MSLNCILFVLIFFSFNFFVLVKRLLSALYRIGEKGNQNEMYISFIQKLVSYLKTEKVVSQSRPPFSASVMHVARPCIKLAVLLLIKTALIDKLKNYFNRHLLFCVKAGEMKSTRKVLNDALGKQASRRSVMQKSGKSSCLIVFAMQKHLRLTIITHEKQQCIARVTSPNCQ